MGNRQIVFYIKLPGFPLPIPMGLFYKLVGFSNLGDRFGTGT
jgi:hypothetical protein